MDGKKSTSPTIKVIGIGGGAIKATNHMIECGIQGVDFIAVNSDKCELRMSKAPTQILIGERRTLGLGHLPASSCREIAEEARDTIIKHLCGTDIVFVVACMGGSMGSGAASVVASYARDMGALTIAVTSKPFIFEGPKRRKNAETGMQELKNNTDTIITISNDSLLQFIDKKTPMTDAFHKADDMIRWCVQSITDLIVLPSIVNIEFNDIKMILSNAGYAKLGYGNCKNGVQDAVMDAIKCPLLENGIEGTTGVILYVTGGKNASLPDMMAAKKILREQVSSDTKLVWGGSIDKEMADNEFQVTAIVINPRFFVTPDKNENNVEEHSMLGGIQYFPKSKSAEEHRKQTESKPIDIPGWLRRPQTENNSSEGLSSRPDGKEVCSYLRNIRIELAQANHIPYETEDCTFTGNCAGTCEKCDQEAAYLRDELNKIPEQDRKYPQHVLKDWKQALCSEK